VPETSVAPATVPTSTAPSTTLPATTTTTAPGLQGWQVTVTDQDFDGDGGACLTVTAAGAPAGTAGARGCLTGAQIRVGRWAYSVVNGTGLGITTDGTTASVTELTDRLALAPGDPTPECMLPIAPGDRLVDVAGCSGAAAIYALLPAAPAGTSEWATTGWTDLGARPTVRPPAFDTPPDVRVATVTGDVGGAPMHCAAIALGGVPGWRESCAPAGSPRWILAGTGDRPVYVQIDAGGAVVAVDGVDPQRAPQASGCRAILAALFAPTPPEVALTGLRCVSGAAITETGRVLVQRTIEPGITLQRDAGDGTWPIGDQGPTLTCARYAQTCAAFGAQTELNEAMLPLPPPAVLADYPGSELGDQLLDPVDATERYAGVGVAASVDALADAVIASIREAPDDPTQFAPVDHGAPPLVITMTRIPDDAIGGSALAVWYSARPGGVGIDAAVEVLSCRRGVSSLSDGTPVCL
jgi:hypothetical protein